MAWLDLKAGGPVFKSCSLPLDGFVFGGPEFNSSTLVNSQLVSLLPVGILNNFLLYLHYLFPLALKSPIEGVVK